MTDEAPLEDGPGGRRPAGPGWFVVNVADGPWSTDDRSGSTRVFDSPQAAFEQIGVDIRVLAPGQTTGLSPGVDAQAGALVLSGECVAVVEDEERPLRAWDYLHLPPRTEHTVVGAGDGPAVLLMLGGRPPEAADADVERPSPGRPPFDGLPWDRG